MHLKHKVDLALANYTPQIISQVFAIALTTNFSTKFSTEDRGGLMSQNFWRSAEKRAEEGTVRKEERKINQR
jgi:hypothetical protein